MFKKLAFLIPLCCLYQPAVDAALVLNKHKIQTVIKKISGNNQLIGVQVAIFDTKAKKTWAFESGVKDTQSLQPLKKSHLMQIGSTTKSFIASLALLLESDSDKGMLNRTFNIEQTVGQWLPEYPDWRNITVKELMNMTSGVMNYTENPFLFDELSIHPHHKWTPRELVQLSYGTRPNTHFPHGKGYEYSNTNYVLLGLIIEKVTGKPLEKVINERLLKPYSSQFKHTFYLPLSYPDGHIIEMAHGYMMIKKHLPFYHQDVTNMTLSWGSSAGGIISNASDLVKWPPLLFSNRLLNKKQLTELKNKICVDAHCDIASKLATHSHLDGYGLGVGYVYDKKYGDIWTHTGGTLGYHTVFLYLPQKHFSIAVIINEIGPRIKDSDDVIYVAKKVLGELRF
jgi:D-alanyl-D-alanine carboxypeptidase